ncbi:MAG: hypothetical protein Q8Q76_00745 [Methylotenera sp.]|nr:hypothetical protein [Methylotenera sp.]
MQDYINEITEFLEFTYNQKTLRLKHRISTVTDEVTKDEMLSDLYQLQENGLDHLSHTIWGGVLTSIFASYENSIIEIFEFFSEKYGFPKFQKKGRSSFITRAEEYSKTNFKVNLFGKPYDKKLLNELSQLRNSYVHNGCSLILLPCDIRKIIEEKAYKDYSLGSKDGLWLANSKNTQLYFHHVYQCVTNYQRRVTAVLFDISKD